MSFPSSTTQLSFAGPRLEPVRAKNKLGTIRLQNQLIQQAAQAENETTKAMAKNKRKLYTIQIPMASLAGLGLYQVLVANNPNARIVRDFQKLMTSQKNICNELERLEKVNLLENRSLPGSLKTVMAQLKTTLQKGGAPYYAKKYMEDIRQQSTGLQNVSLLEKHMESYRGNIQRVLNNPSGLKKFATEPIILSKLNLSRQSAEFLVSHSREAFLQRLFQQGLTGVQMTKFQFALKQLLNVHTRLARLVAGTATFAMVGFFTMINKTKASTLYQRGS